MVGWVGSPVHWWSVKNTPFTLMVSVASRVRRGHPYTDHQCPWYNGGQCQSLLHWWNLNNTPITSLVSEVSSVTMGVGINTLVQW